MTAANVARDRLSAYASLMDEVKFRHAAMRSILNDEVSIPHLIGIEACYLQLRLACELIALGCLVVHGDIPATQTKKLKKAWAADEIINALERLHSDFYPTPVEQVPTGRTAHGSASFDLPVVSDGYLTKVDLVALYRDCGEFLHRGSLEKLHLRPGQKADKEVVWTHLERMVRLLNHHTIQPIDRGYLYVIMMQNDRDGRVQAAMFEKTG